MNYVYVNIIISDTINNVDWDDLLYEFLYEFLYFLYQIV